MQCFSGTLKTCTTLKSDWRLNWGWTRSEPRLFTNTYWPLSKHWSTVFHQCLCPVSTQLSILITLRNASEKTGRCYIINFIRLYCVAIFILWRPVVEELLCCCCLSGYKDKQHSLQGWMADSIVKLLTAITSRGCVCSILLSPLNRYWWDGLSREPGFIPESSQRSAGRKPSQASCPALTALWSPLTSGQVGSISLVGF